MPPPRRLTDDKLIQIVDSAMAEAVRKCGKWLVCRPGCSQCCIGVFPITQLDVLRLRRGLAALEAKDPARAARVRERAHHALKRLTPDFPGNTTTGILDETPEAQEKFEGFGNDEPCPVLDPETGTCDLYSARPMTCRVFGPPLRSGPEAGLGICELCFQGATSQEIAACEVVYDPDNLEATLVQELEAQGQRGNTIVAFCLGS